LTFVIIYAIVLVGNSWLFLESYKEFDMITYSKRSLFSTLGLIVLAGFTYLLLQGYIFPELEEESRLGPGYTSWLPALAYILIAGNICLASNIFRPLRSWKEKGLVWGLTWGLVWGFILGFLLASAAVGTGVAKSGSTIMGTILGLTVGGWLGITIGLISEPYGGITSREDPLDNW